MILDDIRDVLATLAAVEEYPFEEVYYGICTAQSLDTWNYFVFNRKKVTPSNSNSYTWEYEVHIVHENYIMEDYELAVVQALRNAIPGLSLSKEAEYEYVTKGSTEVVVEICTLTLKKARKVDDGR